MQEPLTPAKCSLSICRTPYPGGAPANVAAALAKLGVKVGFISALGQDDLAVQMLDLLSGQPSRKGNTACRLAHAASDTNTAKSVRSLMQWNSTEARVQRAT